MQGLTRLILALCFLSVPAFGAEEEELPGYYVTEGDRLWTNFGRESAVVGSWKGRLEARAVAVNYGSEDNEPDFTGFPLDDLEEALAIAGTPDTVKAVEGTRMDFIGAYGLGPTIEIGFYVPLIVERISFDGSSAFGYPG